MSKKILRGGLVVSLMIGIVLLVGCGQKESERLRKENIELKGKITKLEQELSKLKETAEYYYQQGIDSFSAGNFKQARPLFEIVINRYPNSQLVSIAQARIKEIDKKLVEAERARQEEEERQGIYVGLLDLLVEPAKYLNKRISVGGSYMSYSHFDEGNGFTLFRDTSSKSIYIYTGNLSVADRKKALKLKYNQYITVKGIWRQEKGGIYYLDAEEVR